MWTHHWPPEFSGSALQCKRLSHLLLSRGWDIFVTISSPHHTRFAETVEDGLRLVCIPRSRMKRLSLLAIQTRSRMRRGIEMHRSEFDILHSHSAYLDAAVCAWVAKRLRKPCIIKNTLPGVDLSQIDQGHWGKFQRRSFQTVNAFIGASPAAAEEFETLGFDKEKIHRIPNGVDVDLFHPPERSERAELRTTLGLPSDARILINHSSITKRKGTDMLIEALGKVAGDHPDVHLVLVGPWERDGGPLEGDTPDWFPSLKERVGELGLENRVHMVGAQSNTFDWLRAADVFLFPSLNDLLPNSVLEAMATGLPIVAWRVPFAEAMMKDGESGLLVEPNNIDGFASAISQVVADGEKAGAIGAAARQRAIDRYSLNYVAECYENLYMELMRA